MTPNGFYIFPHLAEFLSQKLVTVSSFSTIPNLFSTEYTINIEKFSKIRMGIEIRMKLQPSTLLGHEQLGTNGTIKLKEIELNCDPIEHHS